MEVKASLFHDVQPSKCTDEVDSAEDDLGDERIFDSYALEDGRTIVKEVVRSRELL